MQCGLIDVHSVCSSTYFKIFIIFYYSLGTKLSSVLLWACVYMYTVQYYKINNLSDKIELDNTSGTGGWCSTIEYAVLILLFILIVSTIFLDEMPAKPKLY